MLEIGLNQGRRRPPLSRILINLPFLIFMLINMPVAAGAQVKATNGDRELNPLQPANTSSPRDTLHSFLTNANVSIEAWRKNQMTPKAFLAARRAIEALDFQTTPDSNSWAGRTMRYLLLQEVLSRVKLPADHEIPGIREVVERNITRWSIPGTQIAIVRISSGPRQGEFLFSAETVERIDSFYRQVKNLPYQPGSTPGVYEAVIHSNRSIIAAEAQFRNRLKPVNTLSPRSTIDGFLDSVNRAYTLVKNAEEALKANPRMVNVEDARRIETKAQNLLRRAGAALDLSHVPATLRKDVATESILQLKEILDRAFLPPLDAIPNEQMVAEARKIGSPLFAASTGGLRWRLPNTQIEIVEITEGPQQGQFLFSADSVAHLDEYYQRVRDLSYRPASFGGNELAYLSPGLSPGFYESYISTPGVLIPQAYWLSSLIDKLPQPFKRMHAGQTVWQWIALSISILLLVLVGNLVFRLVKRLASRWKHPMDSWVLIMAPIIVAILVSAVINFVIHKINITGDLMMAVNAIGNVLVILLIAWVIVRLSKAIAETIIMIPNIADPGPEASLIRVGAYLIGCVIALWVIVKGLKDLGADLIPLIAGLGVGSLAVALAAQRTIANILGSLILFINKPVKVGDFCRYGDQIGTVEEIGWISTRIRSLERTIVTVPNAEFSEMKLDNFAVRDERLFKTILQLRYETTPDQIRYILVQLRELLIGHPMVTPEPARVRFIGFGACSKDLEVFSYLRCKDQGEFLAIQEDILLRMEDIIISSGSGFAFPSQTAYLTRDHGIDANLRDKAESEIQTMRGKGKLPFPDFEDLDFERLEDIIDYPPKGSPDYKPSKDRSRPPPPKYKLPDEIPEDTDIDTRCD